MTMRVGEFLAGVGVIGEIEAWVMRVAEAERVEQEVAAAAGRPPVVDVSTALRGCPPDLLPRVLARLHTIPDHERERIRREVWRRQAAAKSAEKLADMLEEKGREDAALTQRERAAKLRATTEEEVEAEMQSENEKVTSLESLLGVEPETKGTEPETKEEETMVKKAKTTKRAAKARKPKAPRKDPTILLRDPEIKRGKDGKITSITGRCTWRGCTRTRTIHAADAFQVKFCKEHKLEAQRLRARENRQKKAKAKKS